jgi:hypothetical protein
MPGEEVNEVDPNSDAYITVKLMDETMIQMVLNVLSNLEKKAILLQNI